MSAALLLALTAVAALLLVRRLRASFRLPDGGVIDVPVLLPDEPADVLSDEELERSELLSLVTEPILERLGDGGLWLPDGTRVDTLYRPLEQVGGDFLGSIEVDGDVVAFIGDVTGHGLDAAMIALRVKETVSEAITGGASLEEAVTTANDALRQEVAGFATFFACRLRRDGDLRYVNAGHVPPLVVEGGPPDELEPTGPLLGAFSHEFEAAAVEVEPDDRVLAVTDGLIDAFGRHGGLTETEIRSVASRPGGFVDLGDAVAAKRPEDVLRDDIAAFELTVGGDEEPADA